MSDVSADAKGISSKNFRITLEAATLIVLVLPPLWLVLHWSGIPALSPHLRHNRMFLWVLPLFAIFVYGILSEYGLQSRMDVLRRGHRLSGLKPLFAAYFLTTRLEVLAFFAVLSLAMDHTTITGHPWAAKGFITVSVTVIVFTAVMFTVVGTRASYRLSQARS